MSSALTATEAPRCIIQHPVLPSPDHLRHVTHVALAFLETSLLNGPPPAIWPLFTSIPDLRAQLPPPVKILIALGGWADTLGFPAAARTEESRKLFCENVARLLAETGAAGVDMDWEYPGGNGDDYRQVPNSLKAWEVDAYLMLLTQLRAALGPEKVISAAVPGLERDMLAFTSQTVSRIMRQVDFLNVMTYDLMNRRDDKTRHHTSMKGSLESLRAYVARGAAPQQLNLGLAWYVKWFRTAHEECVQGSPVGCPTALLEDPETGADLGRSGAFSWHDPVPAELAESFTRALEQGVYDEEEGAYYYWDGYENIWWTFDTPDAIRRKVRNVLEKHKTGGVFAWGLGEDAPLFEHLTTLNEVLDANARAEKDEL